MRQCRILDDVEFIETTIFTRLVYDDWGEEEYLGLQVFLLRNPDCGKIIPGSDGAGASRGYAQTAIAQTSRIAEIYYASPSDVGVTGQSPLRYS